MSKSGRWMLGASAWALALIVTAAPLSATLSQDVPEVGGNSLGLALGLLASAVALIRARHARR